MLLLFAGLLLVAALVTVIYAGDSTRRSMEQVNHTYRVIAEIQGVSATLRVAESEQRGYLITAGEGYRDAFQRAREGLGNQLLALKELVADNPRQTERANMLMSLAVERLRELNATGETAKRRSFASLQNILTDESEVRVMSEIRAIVGEMVAAEQVLLDQRKQEMTNELKFATTVTVLFAGLALAIGLQAFVFMRRAMIAMDREARLVDDKEKAESSDREKSEFLANMSHEIRTPMNAVLGFAELLSGIVTSPKQRHYVDAINTSGRAMLSLINDILDLSKIEAGRVDLVAKPVSIRAQFNEISNIFGEQAETRGLQFVTQIDDTVPPALVFDPVRLRQILFNVVGNALKFTKEGSVRLSASTRLTETDETKVTLYITVTDTGIGIPSENHAMIFEPFRQVDQGPDRAFGGTGLGLSITRRLTDLLGGRVELESEPGRGTTFRFAFPGVPISAALPDADQALISNEDFNQIRPSRILVADDVALNRELISGYLEGTRHQVMLASNGTDALTLARHHHPDIVLLDIRMPDLNGREVRDQLKADETTSHIPLLAVTASSMMSEELQLRDVFDGYIRKPLTRSVLYRELSQLLPPAADSGAAPDPDLETKPAEPERAAPTPAWTELLAYLRTCAEDPWPLLVKTMGIREMTTFARNIRDRARQAECPPVATYAEELLSHTECFRIAAAETTLKAFPKVVANLAAQVESPSS